MSRAMVCAGRAEQVASAPGRLSSYGYFGAQSTVPLDPESPSPEPRPRPTPSEAQDPRLQPTDQAPSPAPAVLRRLLVLVAVAGIAAGVISFLAGEMILN